MGTTSDLLVIDKDPEQPDQVTIRFQANMDASTGPGLLGAVARLSHGNKIQHLTADLSAVAQFDEYGALVLMALRRQADKHKQTFQLANVPDHVSEFLDQVGFFKASVERPQSKFWLYSLVCGIGSSTMSGFANIQFILAFVGEIVLSLMTLVIHPGMLRKNDTIVNMEKTGVEALPIVALISFLLGLIMAFMSSMQLRQFGAGIYVASLVAFGMVSELGPIMTAIVVAGRSGSAFAAEIGTMKISEEIDALFTMGFDPVRFLALPKIVAAMVVVPILTLFSDLFAIAGGLVVGIFMLNLTPNTFIKQSLDALTMGEVIWGMMKSGCFALLISCTGCLRGFQATGGASAVGNAATSAVVTSIFLIILFDSVFAVIRSYWG